MKEMLLPLVMMTCNLINIYTRTPVYKDMLFYKKKLLRESNTSIFLFLFSFLYFTLVLSWQDDHLLYHNILYSRYRGKKK